MSPTCRRLAALFSNGSRARPCRASRRCASADTPGHRYVIPARVYPFSRVLLTVGAARFVSAAADVLVIDLFAIELEDGGFTSESVPAEFFRGTERVVFRPPNIVMCVSTRFEYTMRIYCQSGPQFSADPLKRFPTID